MTVEAERLAAELLGVCKGVICDGVVRTEEVLGFGEWMRSHPAACSGYPGAVLTARLARILEDGRIDDVERAELHDLMREVAGGALGTRTAKTCLDHPPPPLTFIDREYLFIGRFFTGTREHCEGAVIERRGRHCRRPSQSTDFVVAGAIGGEDWESSSAGRQLMRAIELRTAGAKLKIISEGHWAGFVARIFPGLASV